MIRLKVKAAAAPVTAPDSALRRHSLQRSVMPGLVRARVEDDWQSDDKDSRKAGVWVKLHS